MCLIVFGYNCIPGTPAALAANREEEYARLATEPERGPGQTGPLCGRDCRAGGTWLGVGASGRLIVAIANRPKRMTSAPIRSRGLLCLDLLAQPAAVAAADAAVTALSQPQAQYEGCNILVAGADNAFVVHGGDRLECLALDAGIHIISSGDVDDPRDRRIARARADLLKNPPANGVEWAVLAQQMLGRHAEGDQPALCLHGELRGTVSASVILLNEGGSGRYWHAQGPPCSTPFRDYSELWPTEANRRPG